MKNSPLTTIVLVVLALSALASAYMCWACISDAREARAAQWQANQMLMGLNNSRPVVTALANEAMEYGKQHSDILPLLNSLGVTNAGKPAAAPAPAPAPAATKTTRK
jgi:hypothetical protein